jgi:hypothetical protein
MLGRVRFIGIAQEGFFATRMIMPIAAHAMRLLPVVSVVFFNS